MLGAIIGDIVGSTYEFSQIKGYHLNLLPHGSKCTDDTALTIATSFALNSIEYDFATEYKKISLKHPFFSYGYRYREWFESEPQKPYFSFGNGSAMRVSPVGWFGLTLGEVNRLARKSAMVTHNHPEGLKGAQATATAIYLARNQYKPSDIARYITRLFRYDLDLDIETLHKTYEFNETCQDTVPQALYIALTSENFEDCMRKGLYIGGDSDTLLAIAGGVAQAIHNYIPENLVEYAHQKLQSQFPDEYSKIEFKSYSKLDF